MIHSAFLDNFYLTEEQLENSPSRQDGIDRDTELNLRAYGCELIQEAGILLGYDQVVMATGQVLFHRFYCKRSMKTFNVKKLAATALWEGAKLEEVKDVSKHPRELLEKVMVTIDRCTVRREMPEVSKLPLLEPGSKEYEEFRRSLIRYETEMLKAFGFMTSVEHPHKLLLNYIQVLSIPNALTALGEEGAADTELGRALADFDQYAWNVANDSLRTTLCVRFKGSVVACGVIFYTARKLQVPMPDCWWELFEVQLQDLCEVCRVLHDLYLAPKAQFIPVCHQLLPTKPPAAASGTGAHKGAAPVGATPTPMIGATPELVRPGGKPLDPSVRRPIAASGSTPNLAANGAGPSPPLGAAAGAAPGSARKRSRSRSPLPSPEGGGNKRQQRDGSQPGGAQLPPTGPIDAQHLQQQARAAMAAATGGRQDGAGGAAPSGDRSRDPDRDRDRERGSRRGDSRRRSRSRSRSRERRRSRSRSRSRDGRRSRSREKRRSRSRDSRRHRKRHSRSRSRGRERDRHRDSRDKGARADSRGGDKSIRDGRSPQDPERQHQTSSKLPSPLAAGRGASISPRPAGSQPSPADGFPPPPGADASQQPSPGAASKAGAGASNGGPAAHPAPAGEQHVKAKPVAVRKRPPPAAAGAAGSAAGSPAAAASTGQQGAGSTAAGDGHAAS